jgi:hypothetical protein
VVLSFDSDVVPIQEASAAFSAFANPSNTMTAEANKKYGLGGGDIFSLPPRWLVPALTRPELPPAWPSQPR